ncbi:MAG: hypothetical protein ACREQA_21160 [Candidatus Binatia bacterium]
MKHAAKFTLALLTTTFAVGAGVLSNANVTLSQREADNLQNKIVAINQNGLKEKVSPRRTPVTEAELNSYFVFHGRDKIPAGITDPRVAILGEGRLAGRAMVDMDDVRRNRNSGRWFDPFNYLSGKVPVGVKGVLRTSQGMARFEVETSEISGFPLPRKMLQELVSYFSRTPENPKGLNLDDPFKLPAKIRAIEVAKGEAVVVQ